MVWCGVMLGGDGNSELFQATTCLYRTIMTVVQYQNSSQHIKKNIEKIHNLLSSTSVTSKSSGDLYYYVD